ncbi:MAG: PilT/PilU family type 4a pilus ATPase [Rhodocyclaceae bacterium]|nr:PilT/PilU family type 4a pilus ATPase [Rhodocyclaceae bacterium]
MDALQGRSECTWDVRRLLDAAVNAGASDLHLSAGEVPRLRLDGALRPVEGGIGMDPAAVEAALAVLMSDTQAHDFAVRGDLDFAWQAAGPALANTGGDVEDGAGAPPPPVVAAGRADRFRVNAFRHARGPAAVLRHIPATVPTLAGIDAPAVLETLARLDEGLVLVSGATGSGKSTTLAALVDAINRSRDAHIITIEDPVEFVHTSRRALVSQREVGRDTADFATALRAALREDPDVILVGELRDLETVRLALTAAETGHLVLATLHTRGAASAVDRIVGAFPPGERDLARGSLAASLAAVVCQRLLPRAGGGRVAAHEVLVATPAVRNLIRESRLSQLESVMQTGQAAGMQTFAQAQARLREAGRLGPDGESQAGFG